LAGGKQPISSEPRCGQYRGLMAKVLTSPTAGNPASRMVRLGPREVIVDRHTDGIAYLRSPHPLGPYPVKMTERLDD
jgi:hypothetical protein